MSGNTGQHITVETVVWLPAFLIHSCTHIHTCDTLFAGEAMALACFSFRKFYEKSVEISPRFCYNLFVSLWLTCRG